MDVPTPNGLERAVLTGPDVIARAAARTLDAPEQRWLLRQPRAVRCSFVESVIDGPGDQVRSAERWMLLQKEAVRKSYVKDVLDASA